MGWCKTSLWPLFHRVLAGAFALSLAGCATLSVEQRNEAAGIARAARSSQVDCTRADACALASPLRALGKQAIAASTPAAPRHVALILDDAPDALLVRIHLIRSAQRSIDLQTYIFDEDDSAQLVLDELQAAATAYIGVDSRARSSTGLYTRTSKFACTEAKAARVSTFFSADSWSISRRTFTPRNAAACNSSSTSCAESSSSKM